MWLYLLLRRYLLHLGEDNVHVCTGDPFAISHLAVFAQLGPVLAIHFLPGCFGVAIDCKLPEALLQRGHICTLRHDALWGQVELK